VKSCLLLAGLAADGPVELTEPGPSRDHTERLLGQMGVKLDLKRPLTVTLHPPQEPLRPLTMSLPGDISAASFLIVAAAVVPGSDVTVRAVGLNPTRSGLLDALREMGADIIVSNEGETGGEPMGDVRVRYRPLQGIDVSGPMVVRMIDEFPAFAVAAATAEGVTTVRDAAELRHKESDRIEALCREMSGAGVDIVATEDGFTVRGQSRLRGGAVDPHGDHRLAMALAITGLIAAEGVTVAEAEIIDESFPTFAATLARLGGLVHEAGPADFGADFGMEAYG
jgi:3-phosphoshikimate 1-carboxyvinyltransferase